MIKKMVFEDGLKSYLIESSEGTEFILEELTLCSKEGNAQELEFAINWSPKQMQNKLDETY